MNSIQPAAHVRAVTSFRDSEAGTGSIVSYAWNRSLLWLLVRFLPLVILAFPGVSLAQAAAKTPCRDGSATTVDGTINKFVREAGTRFYITDTALDCGPVYIVAAGEQNCVLGSHIHATGKLTKPVATKPHVDWSLAEASFSCK